MGGLLDDHIMHTEVGKPNQKLLVLVCHAWVVCDDYTPLAPKGVMKVPARVELAPILRGRPPYTVYIKFKTMAHFRPDMLEMSTSREDTTHVEETNVDEDPAMLPSSSDVDKPNTVDPQYLNPP